MASINHDFIDRKRATIALIESRLPNPFNGIHLPAKRTRADQTRKALTHSTMATREAYASKPTRKR